MKSWLSTAIVCGAIVLASACSGGEGDDSAATGTTASQPTMDFAEAAQVTATNSLLTFSDYPAGWTHSPRDLNSPKLGLTGDCRVLESDGLPGDVAHAVSDDFIGPAEQDVTTGSSIFPDENGAKQAFDDYAATWFSCIGQYTALYEKALRDEFATRNIAPGDIQNLNVTMTPTSSSGIGDSMISFRLLTTLTVTGQPMQFVLDAFIVRQGNVLGYLSYYLPGEPDAAEEAQLTQALDAKLDAGALALAIP